MEEYIFKVFDIINRALMSLLGTRLYGWIQINIFRSDAKSVAYHKLSSFPLNDETIKLLTPQQWVQFSKVSEEWETLTSSNKDFQEFALLGHFYGFGQTPSIRSNERTLEFQEFLEIFKLVAPNLEYAKILRHRDYKAKVSKASVLFGRFKYVVMMTKFEEEELMSTFLTRTKKLQQLKINAFEGGTVLEWKQFCQTNPLKCFKFISWTHQDINTFFTEFICLLPSKLEQIGFVFGMDWIFDDEREQQIVELLQRLTRLSKIHFTQNEPFSMMIAKEITNHAKTLQSLTIEHRQYDLEDLEDKTCEENKEDFRILTLVSSCNNLTKLSLSGFTFCEDQCSQIVANCKSIGRLKLDHCDVSEQCLQMLMSLPNLIEIIY